MHIHYISISYYLINAFHYITLNNISIPMKPYTKGKYWMITTVPLCDELYFLVVIIHGKSE